MHNDDQNDKRVKADIILVEEDVLNLKVSTLNDSVDIAIVGDPQDVDSYISKMEEYTSQYLDLLGKLKLGSNEHEFSVHTKQIESKVLEISQDVKITKVLRKKLNEVDSKKQNATLEVQRKQNLLIAQSLDKEIALRGDALMLKLNRDLNGLSDYQLLEVSSDKTVDSESNEIWRK